MPRPRGRGVDEARLARAHSRGQEQAVHSLTRQDAEVDYTVW